MPSTRNQAMDALLTVLAGAYSAFKAQGRFPRDPDDVEDDARPAVFLVEREDPYNRPVPQQPPKREITAWALVYTTTAGNPNTIPSAQPNDILDAFDAALKPDNPMGGKFTIGGRVDACFIDGTVLRGVDKNGKYIMGVPIKIILP